MVWKMSFRNDVIHAMKRYRSELQRLRCGSDSLSITISFVSVLEYLQD